MVAYALLPVKLKSPVPVAALLDVGPVGPQRLLVDVKEADIHKFGWRIPAQIMVRSLLCILVYELCARRLVELAHTRLIYAATFNDNVNSYTLSHLFFCLVLLHCLSGLAAAAVVLRGVSKEEAEAGEDAKRASAAFKVRHMSGATQLSQGSARKLSRPPGL